MADEKSKKRAQRVQLACIPCRQGKLKCNRETICDQCFKRARGSACIYTEKGFRYNTARQKAESMREKIDRLETFVNRLKHAPKAGPEPVSEPEPELELEHSTISRSPNSDETLDPDEPASSIGRLRLQAEGGTTYIGPSHWESIIEDISDVKAYFDLENSPKVPEDSETPDVGNYTVPADVHFGITKTYSKDDLLRLMPPKAEMDRLVSTWFNWIDPMRTILHVPTFQKEYQKFWQAPTDGDLQWLALLLAVASVGAGISGQLRRDSATMTLADRLRALTTHAIVLADYTRPRQYVMETLLLHMKSILLSEHDTGVHAYFVMGLICRLSTLMGFHRDGRHNPALSPLECEMRRRVFLAICEYDITNCYQRGMLSVINIIKFDTQLPANLVDTDFSADHMADPRPADECTPIRIATVYGNLTRIFGDVIYASASITSPSQAEIESLYDRLEESRKSWPPALQPVPLDQAFLDSPELIINRCRLEHQHLKAICVLYRRYLDMPDHEHERERERCLGAAEALVAKQSPILEAALPGGVLASSTVFVMRHVHDFVLAAMLLCSDMKRSKSSGVPLDPEARCVRSRPSVVRACDLWLQLGVTSPRARNALKAITRFVQGEMSSQSVTYAMTPESSLLPEMRMDMTGSSDPFSPIIDFGTVSAFDEMFGFQADAIGGPTPMGADPLYHDLFGWSQGSVQSSTGYAPQQPVEG